MKRFIAIAVATLVVLGAGAVPAVAISSSGTRNCPKKFGGLFVYVGGNWTNRPPGSTFTFTGSNGNTTSGQPIDRVASEVGGGSWKATATNYFAFAEVYCAPR